ncbi:MAG: 4-alpha-glucanotransferase, partial [Clostridiales bacterium]|nr:4-alpha-glucanotransferase [Clostridiales bacterium]
MERKSGVLMHISSLFGDYSSGGFGDEAKYFVDFLAQSGFSYWQVLPFCMVDECNSPYKSYSTFAGNPYFVDLKKLEQKGLLTGDELAAQRQQTPYSCEFVRLYHTRLQTLMRASERVDNGERLKIEKFIRDDKYLGKFCEFMTYKAANDEKPWYEWKNLIIDEKILFMWKFIQYEFFTQWDEIKKYANSKGVGIIGDMPIYVSHDSCDVWSNKHLFQMDADNRLTKVAGVPPDYFSADGQLWGNPLYDWEKMSKDGYSWWCDRLEHSLKLFDGVRIDHFRGLESYCTVDGDAKTARNGEWIKGPGLALTEKLTEIAGDKLIIAEDLGDITEDVVKLVRDSGFPGMRVFQFAFLGDAKTPHLPHNYENNCVAYSGTHDNNTLLGYLWELTPETRAHMLEYCRFRGGDWDRLGCETVIKTLLSSVA